MAVGHGYFLPLSLGQQAFAALHLSIITRVPGNLAGSLGKDATLSNVLKMLDEHYNVIMTFDTLSKALYSLKQGSGENVAEFGVHLSQQVQILPSEYLGRILLEHVEEMN